VDQATKGFETQTALPDVLVAIDSRAAGPLGIVPVKDLEPRQADELVEFCKGRLITGGRDDVVALSDQVTGIETHAEPR
jgi:hypothetical protein